MIPSQTLKEYLAIKAKHPHFKLLYQIGDFFEAFGEDALVLHEHLGLALSRRNQNTEMVGVPSSALDSTLSRLLESGMRALVYQQVPDLSRAGEVKRTFLRFCTPGTSPDLLESGSLVSLATCEDKVFGARIDPCSLRLIPLPPVEKSLWTSHPLYRATEYLLAEPLDRMVASASLVAPNYFDNSFDSSAVLEATQGLVAPSARAVSAAYQYWMEVTQGQSEKLRELNLSKHEFDSSVYLSLETQRALHLISEKEEERDVSLVHSSVYGLIAPYCHNGRKQLLAWLSAPSSCQNIIFERQSVVSYLVHQKTARETLDSCMSTKENGHILAYLARVRRLKGWWELLELLGDLKRLSTALPQDMPSQARYYKAFAAESLSSLAKVIGSLVRKDEEGAVDFSRGASKVLDELRHKQTFHKESLLAYIADLRMSTTLDFMPHQSRYECVVLKANELPKDLPAGLTAVKKLKTKVFFTSPFLLQQNLELLPLQSAIEGELGQLFSQMEDALSGAKDALIAALACLSELDVLLGFAKVATEKGWTRAQHGEELSVQKGLHPLLSAPEPNDTALQKGDVALISGVNMGGKSTYLRQVGVHAVLHQIGAFVPAKSAKLPIFKGIHAHMGVLDNLLKGLSTFGLELRDLAQATKESQSDHLLLLDEIVRGTSPLEGEALAKSALQYFLEKGQATVLIATHYPKLSTSLTPAGRLRRLEVEPVVGNKVARHRIKEVFGDEIQTGMPLYTLNLARQMGVPEAIVAWAHQHLSRQHPEFRDDEVDKNKVNKNEGNRKQDDEVLK